MDTTSSQHSKTKQQLVQIAFFMLHAIFILLTAVLLLFAYAATRGYGFPGLIFAVPPIVILAQTIPYIAPLSKQTKALIAQSIATLPSLLVVLYFVIVAFDTGLASEATFLYLSILSITVIASCVFAYSIFKAAITTPQPIHMPPQSSAPARTPSQTMMLGVKVIFVLLFLVPISIGVVLGIAQTLSSVAQRM